MLPGNLSGVVGEREIDSSAVKGIWPCNIRTWWPGTGRGGEGIGGGGGRAERESEVVLLSKELGHTVLGSGVGGVGGGGGRGEKNSSTFKGTGLAMLGFVCVCGGGGGGGVNTSLAPFPWALWSLWVTLQTDVPECIYIYARANRPHTHVKGACSPWHISTVTETLQ